MYAYYNDDSSYPSQFREAAQCDTLTLQLLLTLWSIMPLCVLTTSISKRMLWCWDNHLRMYFWYDPIQSEWPRLVRDSENTNWGQSKTSSYVYILGPQTAQLHATIHIGTLLNQEALIQAAGSRVRHCLRTVCVGCSEESSLVCPRPLRSLGHRRWSVATYAHAHMHCSKS